MALQGLTKSEEKKSQYIIFTSVMHVLYKITYK
jgi:hypothetical protein